MYLQENFNPRIDRPFTNRGMSSKTCATKTRSQSQAGVWTYPAQNSCISGYRASFAQLQLFQPPLKMRKELN